MLVELVSSNIENRTRGDTNAEPLPSEQQTQPSVNSSFAVIRQQLAGAG